MDVQTSFDITNHKLVPEHIKLSEQEKDQLLNKYNISLKQMPTILDTDAAIKNLNAKPGDIIMIKRKSQTTKESLFYRVVING